MSDSIRSYRDLRVWQAGMGITEQCYCLTRGYPKEELYGTVSQIRRALASIPVNIAEGHGRESTGDYIHCLRVAQGSLKELETWLLLSERLDLASPEEIETLLSSCEQIGKMLHGLIVRLNEHRLSP